MARTWLLVIAVSRQTAQSPDPNNYLRGLSPGANYIDLATAACRQS
jgi:hypothetical protein